MRRLSRPLISVLAAALLLAGCSGTGSISIPTQLPSISLPSVDLPSIELPAIPRPGGTESDSGDASSPPAQTVTETATRTVTASSEATTPAAGISADEADGTGTPWWPWLLLLVLVAAVIAWLVVRRRRAQQLLDEWDVRLTRARGEAAWVEQSLVAQVLGRPTRTEAASVWAGAQGRLLAIDEDLHALTTDAPDEARAAAAVVLRDRFQRLVSVVGADTAPGQGSRPDDVRASRITIDQARADLRAVLDAAQHPAART